MIENSLPITPDVNPELTNSSFPKSLHDDSTTPLLLQTTLPTDVGTVTEIVLVKFYPGDFSQVDEHHNPSGGLKLKKDQDGKWRLNLRDIMRVNKWMNGFIRRLSEVGLHGQSMKNGKENNEKIQMASQTERD